MTRFFLSLSLPKSSIAGLSPWLRTRLEFPGVAAKVGLAAIAFTGAAELENELENGCTIYLRACVQSPVGSLNGD